MKKQIWTNPSFLLLLFGQLFAVFGNILFNVAVISYVYAETNSLTSATFILIISTCATMFGSFFANTILDKTSHKKVMIYADLLRFIFIVLLGIIVHFFQLSIWLVYCFTGILNFISSFFYPAKSAIIPQIVPKESLVQGNSFYITTNLIIQTTGWAVSVPIVTYLGTTNSIYINGLTFLISALFISLIQPTNASIPKVHRKKENTIVRFRKAISYLRNNTIVRKITVMDFYETIANIVWIPTFLLAFTVEALNVSEKWWGFQGSAYFFGLLVGVLIAVKYAKQISQIGGKIIVSTSIFMVFLTIAYAINPFASVAVLLSFLDGPPYQLRNIVQESLIQNHSSEQFIGRVFAIRNMLFSFVYAVALFIGSIFGDLFGIRSVFFLAAIIYLFIAIYAYRSKEIRHFKV